MKAVNLIGQRFGSFEVLSRVENSADRHARWLCRCDCGAELIITGKALRAGKKSCSCQNQKYINELGNKYGKLTVILLF